MKKLYFLFLLLMFTNIFAHKEWVHQYIAQESYRYPAQVLGVDIPDLKSHVGLTYFGKGSDSDPWSVPYVSVAAWREDLEDVIWGYGGLFEGWTPSITHFWEADKGFYEKTSVPASEDAYNACYKARKFMYGNTRIFFAKTAYAYDLGQVILGRYYSYDNLVDFYNTGHCYYEGYISLAGNVYLQTPQEIYMNLETARDYTYQILGRISHLLADMSVPAHTREDFHNCGAPHFDGDTYELYLGGNATGDCNAEHSSFPAKNWNKTTALNQGTILDISQFSFSEVISYLFYTVNQITAYFPSKGEGAGFPHTTQGNGDLLSLDSKWNEYILERFQVIGNRPTTVNHTQIANETLNLAIRATATLYYFFAKETGQYTPPLPATPSISMSGSWGDNPTLSFSVGGSFRDHYNLKKEYDFGSGYGSPYYVNPASNPYTDPNVEITRFGGDLVARYSVQAIDIFGQSSAFSNTVTTSGQSLWKSQNDQNEQGIISEYVLESNYPNPFNPVTVLSYQIPVSGFVNLTVYNPLGQIVAVLVNEHQIEGRYSVQFNANNLPSGIYFYKLQTGKFSSVMKMILAK